MRHESANLLAKKVGIKYSNALLLTNYLRREIYRSMSIFVYPFYIIKISHVQFVAHNNSQRKKAKLRLESGKEASADYRNNNHNPCDERDWMLRDVNEIF